MIPSPTGETVIKSSSGSSARIYTSGVVPPPSGPVLVQQAVAVGIDSGSGFQVNLLNAVGSGNYIIVCISHATGTVNSVTPGFSLADLTLVGTSIGTGITVDMFALTPTDPGDTFVTISATTSVSLKVSISEWSGLSNATVENEKQNATSLSSTVTTENTIPNSTNNLIIAVGGWTANNYSSGPSDGFTRMTPVGSLSAYQEVAYLVQSSADPKNTTWMLTAPLNSTTVIAAFGAP